MPESAEDAAQPLSTSSLDSTRLSPEETSNVDLGTTYQLYDLANWPSPEVTIGSSNESIRAKALEASDSVARNQRNDEDTDMSSPLCLSALGE